MSPNSAQGWTRDTAVYVPVLPSANASAYQAGMARNPDENSLDDWNSAFTFRAPLVQEINSTVDIQPPAPPQELRQPEPGPSPR